MSARYLRRKEVLARYSVTNCTLYRWIRGGLFPAPVTLVAGGRAVGWSEASLDGHDRTNEGRTRAERAKLQAKKKAALVRRPRGGGGGS